MSSGFYTTYLGMKAREEAIDIIANNLANMSTTGYKADSPFFQAYQTALEETNVATEPEELEQSVMLQDIKTDFATGPVRQTGRELDVAIEGEGFFVVQTPNGERFTRNGSFTLDASGQLVTSDGHLVVGEGGPLTLPAGPLSIDRQGNLNVNGQAVGQLRIVTFASVAALHKEGNNLFKLSDPNQTSMPAPAAQVLQGHIEGSNVNSLKEMTLMMKYMREFESLQRMLVSMTNELNTSSMGRINS